MKAKLDFPNKTITLERGVSVAEFIDTFEKLLPDFRQWTLEVDQQPFQQPFTPPYIPITEPVTPIPSTPWPWYPWYTGDSGVVQNEFYLNITSEQPG